MHLAFAFGIWHLAFGIQAIVHSRIFAVVHSSTFFVHLAFLLWSNCAFEHFFVHLVFVHSSICVCLCVCALVHSTSSGIDIGSVELTVLLWWSLFFFFLVQAAILAGADKETLRDILTLDVIPRSVGFEVTGGGYEVCLSSVHLCIDIAICM